MKRLMLTLLIAALTTCTSVHVVAADTPAAPAEKKSAKARPLPYRGKITSVDKQAKTVTIGERVFQVTSDSKITKAGKPATLDDVTAGEEVGASYKEGADKKSELVSLRLGAKPAAPSKEKKETK